MYKDFAKGFAISFIASFTVAFVFGTILRLNQER